MHSKINLKELDKDFCNEVSSLPGGENIKKCFACGTCASGCPVTSVDEEYNCRTIIRQIRLGMREDVLKSPKIWYCMMCYRCYSRCPQKVNFTDVMRALRYLAIKNNYISSDMMKKSDEIELIFQNLRTSIIKETIEGKNSLLEDIKQRLIKD
jgi:heterodisulfide reductase subunit C2